MSGRLEGKVVLITGTGGGQGQAAAVRFAKEGALVVGCDVKEEGNLETVEMVKEAGFEMQGMAPVDLGDAATARKWVEEAATIHGRIDVLYNNASSPKFTPMPEMTVEDWDFTVRNELDIIFYVSKYAWPYLAERGGVIINVGSINGHIATRGGGSVAHMATKGGVIAMTKAMASDGAEDNIRVVSISPGVVMTPGAKRDYFDVVPGAEEEIIKQLLVKRVGLPDDIVGLAVYVASDEAYYLTGSDILIDGGMTAI